MVVKWNNIAKQDLNDFKSITQMSKADEYIINLAKYVDTLSLNPRLGKIFIYVRHHIVRQLVYKQHKIFYYVNGEIITILSVVHHKQNMDKKLQYIKNYISQKH